jgi:hypothetical protein
MDTAKNPRPTSVYLVAVPEDKTGLDVEQADNVSVSDNLHVFDALAEKQYASLISSRRQHHFIKTFPRLLRKIDIRVIPACMVIYTLSFLDRSNIVSFYAPALTFFMPSDL